MIMTFHIFSNALKVFFFSFGAHGLVPKNWDMRDDGLCSCPRPFDTSPCSLNLSRKSSYHLGIVNVLVFFYVGSAALQSFLLSFRSSTEPNMIKIVADNFPTVSLFYVGWSNNLTPFFSVGVLGRIVVNSLSNLSGFPSSCTPRIHVKSRRMSIRLFFLVSKFNLI